MFVTDHSEISLSQFQLTSHAPLPQTNEPITDDTRAKKKITEKVYKSIRVYIPYFRLKPLQITYMTVYEKLQYMTIYCHIRFFSI